MRDSSTQSASMAGLRLLVPCRTWRGRATSLRMRCQALTGATRQRAAGACALEHPAAASRGCVPGCMLL